MWFIFLLLCALFMDDRSLGYSPINAAVVVGKPMLMVCGVHSNETVYKYTVEWKFQSTDNTQTKLLFNGYIVSRKDSDLFIRNDAEGEFNLAKNRSHLNDAGAYHCIKRFQDQHSLRTDTNIAQLTILESDPTCGSNASYGIVVEGDHLRIWCSVNYSGNLDPVMEWSRNDRGSVDSIVSYSNDTFPRTVTCTSYQAMNVNDDKVIYSCKTYFKTPIFESEKDGSSSATNAPDYRDECKLTINLLFGPRNMSITPRKNTYIKGEQVRCSGSGNPPPTYSWREVGSDNFVDGPLLTVDETMEQRRDNTFLCTAENIVAGKKKTASEIITLNVAVIDLSYITLSMGVICVLLLLTVIVIGRQHIKGCIANAVYVFRRGPGTEPDILPNAGENHNDGAQSYELQPYGHYVMPAEAAAFGHAQRRQGENEIECHALADGAVAIIKEQRAEAEVPVYAEINKLCRSESDCKASIQEETTMKPCPTNLSIGLDGTIYAELKTGEGLHKLQASGSQFQDPLFNKSHYACIDHTTEPPPPPQAD